MDSSQRQRFVQQFIYDELLVFYTNYRSYLHDQEYLLTRGRAYLRMVLNEFPRLSAIQFTEEAMKERAVFLSIDEFSCMNKTARKMLALPVPGYLGND